MSSRNKYQPDCSWEDVVEYINGHTRATGAGCYVRLFAQSVNTKETYCEVCLYDISYGITSRPIHIRRGPLPLRGIERLMRSVLHTVAQAYQDVEEDHWLWPERKRREVVQE